MFLQLTSFSLWDWGNEQMDSTAVHCRTLSVLATCPGILKRQLGECRWGTAMRSWEYWFYWEAASGTAEPGGCPGPKNRLPADYCKTLSPVIGKDSLTDVRHSLNKGQLLLSTRRAVLILLIKRDQRERKNWRPVVLHCTQAESMFLPAPLRVIEQVIYVDQTYYVPRLMISGHFFTDWGHFGPFHAMVWLLKTSWKL